MIITLINNSEFKERGRSFKKSGFTRLLLHHFSHLPHCHDNSMCNFVNKDFEDIAFLC